MAVFCIRGTGVRGAGAPPTTIIHPPRITGQALKLQSEPHLVLAGIGAANYPPIARATTLARVVPTSAT